jgi:hypothetical protein
MPIMDSLSIPHDGLVADTLGQGARRVIGHAFGRAVLADGRASRLSQERAEVPTRQRARQVLPTYDATNRVARREDGFTLGAT